MRRLLPLSILLLLSFAAHAAAPTVEGSTTYEGQSAAQTHDIAYVSCAADDLFLLVGGYSAADGISGITASGFTFVDESANGNNVVHFVGYKVSAGTETGNLTLDITDSTNRHLVATMFCLSGIDTMTAPQVPTAATGTGDPDPPSISGLASDDYLYVATAIRTSIVNDITSMTDGDYSATFNLVESGGSGAVEGATAYFGSTATTGDDPAFFDDTGTFAWVTQTVAVTPGSASPATLSSATPSGTLGTDTTATLGATTDVTSGTFYGVVDTAGNIAGISAAQVKAGDNNMDSAAVAACNDTVSDTSPSCGVTGLTADTGYSYAVVQNSAGGDSNVLTGTFTTAEASSTVVPIFSQHQLNGIQ